jgi:hypothetical protein
MRRAKARIILRSMAGNRGPGGIVAVINDASNIGASTYYNSPGEMYFTLPIDHPQAGEVEPWRRHYAVEENVGGVWKQKYEGLIVDFDANADDVVFYGMDYLGLLDKVIDGRFVVDEPDASPPEGSKYVDNYLSTIIKSLIDYARNKSNSPVGFIPRGSFDTFNEKITIHSTLASIGAFVQGLIESHRQGTGKRSRLYVRRDSATAFKFVLANNPGVDRKGIRLTYGGMVQGFNIIGFGDFASRAYGIGRTLKGSELFYKVAGAPGTSPSHYGSIETVDFYDNVHDKNDLLRRVKQRAASMGRVGKRVAIGLKVEGMRPFDGYDIADSVIVDIKRGIIDTMRYGSGLWMIHGVEWRVFPDGHDELTLVVLPKEDGVAADKDLLVAQEVLPAPISVNDLPVITDPAKLGPDVVQEVHIHDGAVTDDKVKDLHADSITQGVLTLGGPQPAPPDPTPEDPTPVAPVIPTVVAYDSEGDEIGRWSEQGLVISDAHNPDQLLRLTESTIEFSNDAGLTWQVALDASGLNASAIGSGAPPGGHNRIPNAGFEMSVFTAPVSKVWTLTADWSAYIAGSAIAIDATTGDLKIAAGSF